MSVDILIVLLTKVWFLTAVLKKIQVFLGMMSCTVCKRPESLYSLTSLILSKPH